MATSVTSNARYSSFPTSNSDADESDDSISSTKANAHVHKKQKTIEQELALQRIVDQFKADMETADFSVEKTRKSLLDQAIHIQQNRDHDKGNFCLNLIVSKSLISSHLSSDIIDFAEHVLEQIKDPMPESNPIKSLAQLFVVSDLIPTDIPRAAKIALDIVDPTCRELASKKILKHLATTSTPPSHP